MIPNDFNGKAVLITGGTKGFGLAIGKAFGLRGAQVYLTNRWGSADEDEIRARFKELGAPAPIILEADASNEEDTQALLETIKKDFDRIEVFVSNVAFARVNKDGLDGMMKRHFFMSLEYTAWPLMGYVQGIKKTFGHAPNYTLGTSSDGADNFYPGYDYVASCKAVMETFAKYMAKHLWEEERCRVNILRSRPVATASLEATFGPEFEPFMRKWHGDDFFVDLEAVGDAALALCSGLMDAVNGQVIQVDQGVPFSDNLMRLFAEREKFGLRDDNSQAKL